MVYTAYWKKASEVIWHKITSNSPITWTQEPIQPNVPNGAFQGGQCPNVRYTIKYDLRKRTSSQFNCGAFEPWMTGLTSFTREDGTTPSSIWGPVSEPTYVPVATLDGGNTIQYRYRFTAKSQSGATTYTLNLNLEGSGRRSYWVPCGINYEFRNFQVIRFDGGEDGCGNSPNYPSNANAQCKTTFSTGFSVTDTTCVEVRTTPPGCECCEELLPIATRILRKLP